MVDSALSLMRVHVQFLIRDLGPHLQNLGGVGVHCTSLSLIQQHHHPAHHSEKNTDRDSSKGRETP